MWIILGPFLDVMFVLLLYNFFCSISEVFQFQKPNGKALWGHFDIFLPLLS